MLRSAEIILERDGLQALTLRAVARQAGVSHAAPTHHFGNLVGLMSELAALGFQRFADTVSPLAPGEAVPTARGRIECARAYIAFAQAHPQLYELMFRGDRLDMSRPALRAALDGLFASISDLFNGSNDKAADSSILIDEAASILRTWSFVHGFATLLGGGRLSEIVRRSPQGTTVELLFLRSLG